MSALSVHFLTRFSIINVIHPHVKADQHVLCNTCCDLAKYQGHQILATLYVQGQYIHFILVGGLLTVSDIMAKLRNYLAHVCQFKTCCDLGHSVKVTDLISILSCLKVTVFLLILLQSSHWISRYNIDNL